MCNPLKSPLSGLGLAAKAVKKGGVMGALSPGLALAGAFRKKSDQRYGGGPNADGSMSFAGGS